MEIRINRKPAMTEQEQKEAFKGLFATIHHDKRTLVPLGEYGNKAMKICKNEHGEVESIEITVSSDQVHNIGLMNCNVKLTANQIIEIQAIKL